MAGQTLSSHVNLEEEEAGALSGRVHIHEHTPVVNIIKFLYQPPPHFATSDTLGEVRAPLSA